MCGRSNGVPVTAIKEEQILFTEAEMLTEMMQQLRVIRLYFEAMRATVNPATPPKVVLDEVIGVMSEYEISFMQRADIAARNV
jgi:hypothetical protein